MSQIFQRPTLSRDVSVMQNAPDTVVQAPPTQGMDVPSLGDMGGTQTLAPMSAGPIMRTEENAPIMGKRTLSVKGPNPGGSAIADFLTALGGARWGGGQQLAAQNQERRFGETQHLLDIQQQAAQQESAQIEKQFADRQQMIRENMPHVMPREDGGYQLFFPRSLAQGDFMNGIVTIPNPQKITTEDITAEVGKINKQLAGPDGKGLPLQPDEFIRLSEAMKLGPKAVQGVLVEVSKHRDEIRLIQERAKNTEPEKPLGSKADALNQAFTARYQIMNPGQKLPAFLSLSPDSTQKDFDRIDKVMQQTESAKLTKAQQDAVNESRRQAQETLKQTRDQAQQDREEKQGLKWVSWEEGDKTVAGPMSLAKERGAKNFAEVPTQEIRDLTNARHAVRLMTKKGDPSKPETNGVLQLIDSLDKDGKLGVLASRWNSFLATGVGASPGDDPRIITLLDKNMLGDTATMLAHFGASGGRSPQMLQHFLDLANSKKMDGPTLKAGVKAMADYMGDRAMLPSENSTSNTRTGPKVGDIKTFPNGNKGKWDGQGWVQQQ